MCLSRKFFSPDLIHCGQKISFLKLTENKETRTDKFSLRKSLDAVNSLWSWLFLCSSSVANTVFGIYYQYCHILAQINLGTALQATNTSPGWYKQEKIYIYWILSSLQDFWESWEFRAPRKGNYAARISQNPWLAPLPAAITAHGHLSLALLALALECFPCHCWLRHAWKRTSLSPPSFPEAILHSIHSNPFLQIQKFRRHFQSPKLETSSEVAASKRWISNVKTHLKLSLPDAWCILQHMQRLTPSQILQVMVNASCDRLSLNRISLHALRASTRTFFMFP